ncbi:MAG: Stk1 family PASTA domain-containing Ser/Thr kinase [Clostridium sp.]|nr:Stk1 family PASTA domain-containing Ser/Thr kinase [Clostridium sp.]
MLKTGEYLQNRYEILALIGTGGMSEVYQAKCHVLNRLVGIKVLKEEYSRDANFVSKFKMEAQSAASLSHPNIVSIYDVIDEENLHYIVMELIEGITLKSYIKKKGHLGIKEAIGIAIQVAQGIAAAHDQHIVHRDIKPQNMIISRDGKVKVADFGIARAVSEQTVGGPNAVGSVHYISPEQARGEYSDARSDIYSLGVTMFEMVTGTVPFDGDNPVTIALAHLEKEIPAPETLNPEVTPSMSRIIRKCTEKLPEDRYQDAYELIADLRHALVDPEDDYLKAEADLETAPTNVREDDSSAVIRAAQAIPERPRRRPAESYKQYKRQTQDNAIDKLLSSIGIIAGLIIAVVVIVILIRLSGIFNMTSGQKESETAAVESVTETAAEPVVVETSETPIEITEEEVAKVDLRELGIAGMNAEAAVRMLENRDLVAEVREENNETVEKGMVISFSPEEPAVGDTVTLLVSLGPVKVMVPVPDITGIPEESALSVLTSVGLVPGVRTEAANEAAKGTVVSQKIEKQTEVEKGSAVDYVVSAGKGTHYVAAVDDVISLQEYLGPSAASTVLEVSIVMKQYVNGESVTKVVMEPTDITGDTAVPVHYNIEGADGVPTGTLQVLDLTNDRVLKTYNLSFVEMDR